MPDTPAAGATTLASTTPPSTTTRRARGLLGKPEAESDPKRREILARAARALDELRQYDAVRADQEKQRTNRKAMVLGLYFLAVMARDEKFAQATVAALDSHLTDKTERELFGLAPSR